MSSPWFGVDIGGTKTAVLLSFDPPAVAERIEFPTLPADGPERALLEIESAIRAICEKHGVRPHAIGISCGGPLNRHTGVIQAPPNLWTWIDVPITQRLSGAFQCECLLENDANAGAVAEHRYGAGVGTSSMIFLTMGTGLGAGLIIDGRLYHGASDMAGEIGHVRLTPSGPVGCNKAGSVEGWASGGGMAQVAAAAVRDRQQPTVLGPNPTALDVANAAKAGDALAAEILESTGLRLGDTLAILVDILNPERIVIGGLAMRLGDAILDPARQVLAAEGLEPSVNACQVVPAALGERIGDVAALCIARGYCK
jgi:glucokinase